MPPALRAVTAGHVLSRRISRLSRGAATLVVFPFALLLTAGCDATDPGPEVERIVGNTVVPERRDFSEALLPRLQLPDGFQITAFATGLLNPRMIAVAEDGTVYVTRQMQNDVVALRDTDRDGRAETSQVVAGNLELVHGIALRGDQVYLASPTTVWVADRAPDGTLSPPRLITDDLPQAGQHRARTIGFGPDGLMYISVGSTCNACEEPNVEQATMLRAQPDGSGRTVIARGLRHTIGFAWHPSTGEMWGMDMGTDWRGDDRPPEELNRIQQGANYGWPYCFGYREPDEAFNEDPDPLTKEQFCAQTEFPALAYPAHNSPVGMAFYTGAQFPEEYRGDAFVAMRGSWNRNPPTGYKVIRINFENGQPLRMDDFVTGFLIEGGRAQFARLTGVAVATDGALLVADDENGVIYRVAYVGGGK